MTDQFHKRERNRKWEALQIESHRDGERGYKIRNEEEDDTKRQKKSL